jgi:ATP-dependent 26S proteasome regulatory subunit
MRPGRLDRILYVDAPDQAARHEIFRIRLSKMAVEPDLSIEPLASIVRFILTGPRLNLTGRPKAVPERRSFRYVKMQH